MALLEVRDLQVSFDTPDGVVRAERRANDVVLENRPVTLEFEKAGKVQVSLDVAGVGAQAPAHEASPDGQMQMKMKKTPDHSGMKM